MSGTAGPGSLAAHGVLATLGADAPLVAAPMAGGPSGPPLVAAAARAGATGFLAGGYLTPDALAAQVAETRRSTERFGVNLFAPPAVPVDPAAFRAYASQLADLAASFGVDLDGAEPREDDDHWRAKIDLLVDLAVPLVSFTFGLPSAADVEALRAVGTTVVQTVTSPDEAARAEREAGPDVLVVQSSEAGGHSGTLDPARPPASTGLTDLVAAVRAVTDLPVWAAGGLATPGAVRAVLEAGAEAAVVGTVLLRAPESGANATYKAALADPARTTTVVTRAFSGRPARALVNGFVERFDADAPAGYPALHHLTSPIRRAAAAAGDPEAINIWAGTGHAHGTDEPAEVVLRRLAAG
ncbi:nitronate monooxygenase [Nocardioides zeae]|uniref:Propionate 3-nitronate monooxygenase n=1 Tax=Nocardioides imazamoxiresistens TaxID=3231893 RepID=A0ABU3Q0M6_9ACTN|nr:nitronate monooxygenase [Nocardioides zeae]MDT9595068.1 nitronate monooxygenase [Nocardioides zeae]